MIPKTARLLHWDGPLPEIGWYLRTSAGSMYLVSAVKINTRPNPKSVAKLDLLKLYEDDKQYVPDDAIIAEFAWGDR